LNPHWASEKCALKVARSNRLYDREMNSRFGRRTTRDPFDNRVPMATSL
jgi:hypothetical protein